MNKEILEPSSASLKKMMVTPTRLSKACPDPCSCKACHCGGKCNCGSRQIRRNKDL